jgi:two-component system NtrC family response regulator
MRNQPIGSKQHLLFNDDESEVRDLLSKYFHLHGYRVTTTDRGEEAIRVIDNEPVDLMVTDIVMPEFNGLDLLEHVRENHPHLPVIMYTGLGYDEETLQESLRRGASAFVAKGLPLSQLLMEVRGLLNYARAYQAR